MLKALESTDKLLSIMSHDLRNPLGAVLAYADLLTGNPDLSGRALKQSEAIRRAAERMHAMILNLVDVHKLAQGDLHLGCQPEDICEATADVLTRLEPIAAAREIKLSARGLDQKARAAVDRQRFEQALTIIIQNAIQHSPQSLAVEIELSVGAGRVQIAIIDQGPGFSAEDTLRDARPARGLSLYLARELIVTGFKGQLGFEKGAGARGTRAVVDLPILT